MGISLDSIAINNAFASQIGKSEGSSFGTKSNGAKESYYAKKGEPMYMKEMDADEDGIVSFDEFKDYCDKKGISTKDRIKITEMANSYRNMQTQKKSNSSFNPINNNKFDIKSILEEAYGDPIYATRGDSKYDEAMDTNSDDKVSFKEYAEYCIKHITSKEQKSNAKVETTEDGKLKITNAGKAINSYTRAAETESLIEAEA